MTFAHAIGIAARLVAGITLWATGWTVLCAIAFGYAGPLSPRDRAVRAAVVVAATTFLVVGIACLIWSAS